MTNSQNIQQTLVNCLSACHDLLNGWLYPEWSWLDMSPDMLTLVAVVLAYDRAVRDWVWEICEPRSSALESRKAISETRFENDIVGFSCYAGEGGKRERGRERESARQERDLSAEDKANADRRDWRGSSLSMHHSIYG